MEEVIPIKNKISYYTDIKIAPFDPNKRFTKPHRHNKYFEIVYLSKAEGYHYIDDIAYKIDGPTFFFIRKEAVHHWDISTIPEGYVVIFKESFLQNTLDDTLNTLLMKLNNHHEKKCTEPEFVEELFKLLCFESNREIGHNKLIFEGLLKALLAHLNTNLEIQDLGKADEFLKMLADNPVNNVSFYADKLQLSNQQLNQLCKKEYGKTTSEVIASHINTEAKRLLKYSKITISEIAFHLNFKNASHFVKYFKKHNAVTPLNFRKEENRP